MNGPGKGDSYKRGSYYKHPEWAKDTSQAYYQGFRLKIVWPLTKIAIMVTLLQTLRLVAGLSLPVSVGICFAVVWFYQDVVAFMMGYKRMASMDAMCFISSSKAHVNYMCVTCYDQPLSRETILHNFNKMLKLLPKFQYVVEECCGDYYYR